MKLSFSEEFLLILYLEFFDREYDINNVKIKRHIEMQNIAYLVHVLDIYIDDFGFVWASGLGPNSLDLQIVLDKLDSKSQLIERFYEEYSKKRNKYYGDYKNQLIDLLSGNYCYEYQANRLAVTSYVLNDVMKASNGSDLLARVIYLFKTRLPGCDLSRIIKELQATHYDVDIILLEKIWKDLAIIGIRGMEEKKSNVKKRVLGK